MGCPLWVRSRVASSSESGVAGEGIAGVGGVLCRDLVAVVKEVGDDGRRHGDDEFVECAVPGGEWVQADLADLRQETAVGDVMSRSFSREQPG